MHLAEATGPDDDQAILNGSVHHPLEPLRDDEQAWLAADRG